MTMELSRSRWQTSRLAGLWVRGLLRHRAGHLLATATGAFKRVRERRGP